MADVPTSAERSDPTSRAPGKSFVLLPAVVLACLAALAAAVWLWQNDTPADAPQMALAEETGFMPKVTKSDEEWRAQLTPEQYEVTRQKGTERAFTGQYWNHKEKGSYNCIGCGAELFTSKTKYESGCGWPSFFAADHEENLHTETDMSFGMIRTEVMCSNCGAHLGHVFDDGPAPTGQRYCINSASLDFEKADGDDTKSDE